MLLLVRFVARLISFMNIKYSVSLTALCKSVRGEMDGSLEMSSIYCILLSFFRILHTS
jgi:hypothetical protein